MLMLSTSGAGAGQALLAQNSSPSADAGACYGPAEVKPEVFPDRPVVMHDFTGSQAGKLSGVIAALVEQAVPPAALVMLVLPSDSGQALAFEFAADGCHTVTLTLDLASMAAVFQTAGVAAPFDAPFSRAAGTST